jgi:hypothetical protein
MGIWGDYGRRNFNISPLDEGIGPLNSVVIATLRPVAVTEFIDERKISRQDAIKILREAGYESVVETRDLNAMLDDLATDWYPEGPWTGFFSRLDQVWVLCFNNRLDAEPFWKHHASLE